MNTRMSKYMASIPDGRNFQVKHVRVGWHAYHAIGDYSIYLLFSNQPNGFTNSYTCSPLYIGLHEAIKTYLTSFFLFSCLDIYYPGLKQRIISVVVNGVYAVSFNLCVYFYCKYFP